MSKMNEMSLMVDEAVALRRKMRGKWSLGRAALEVAEKYDLSNEAYEYLHQEVEFWDGKPKQK